MFFICATGRILWRAVATPCDPQVCKIRAEWALGRHHGDPQVSDLCPGSHLCRTGPAQVASSGLPLVDVTYSPSADGATAPLQDEPVVATCGYQIGLKISEIKNTGVVLC